LRTVLGIISDTHGLLRPEAIAALRGSEHILHAGDVGAPEILEKLSEIALVTAIRGNIDKAPWARKLPETEVFEAGGISIYILHDLAKLDLNPKAAGFSAVIYGHSHAPKQETKNGVLYLNPAAPGHADSSSRSLWRASRLKTAESRLRSFHWTSYPDRAQPF
jgi:putative phosphoesterase